MAKWDKESKPWERQKGESAQAFEAFDIYLKQGKNRSLRRVAQELGKSNTLITRWSSKYQWQERLRLYTNEIKKNEFAEEQRLAKQMRKRQLAIAELMQRKGLAALKKIDEDTIFAKDVIRLITEGMRLETEIRNDSINQSANELGVNGGSESVAETIISAYQKRTEEGDEE